VRHYNEVRLHSALGYVTPAAKLAGSERAIFAERDRKLEAARERRKTHREMARQAIRSHEGRSEPIPPAATRSQETGSDPPV
jgi:hypothetical protein